MAPTGAGPTRPRARREGGGRAGPGYLRMLCASMLRFWLLEHTTATRSGEDGMAVRAARPGPAPAPALAPRTKWRPRRGGGRGPSVSPGGAGGRHREEGMAERVCGGVCDL